MVITVVGSLTVASAQAAGLTVKPASLRVSVPWGGAIKTELLVTNTTDVPGMYQVAMEPASAGTVTPDGFRLAPGETQLLTVNVARRWLAGAANVAVVALPLDGSGVAVGSGVKVPLHTEVLMPWWLVSLAWLLPLLAIGWRWLRRGRLTQRDWVPNWVALGIATIIVASVGLVALLAVADWPVRSTQRTALPTTVNVSQSHRLTVDFGDDQPLEAEVPATASATAFSLLEMAAAQQRVAVESRDYGSLGVLVTGIGGVYNDVRTKKYWYVWVNGEFARASASRITLAPGDHVEWRYVNEMQPLAN